MKRRVLLVSAHFPPDSGAASHRLRLLAPGLPDSGWDPTVLTVDPDPAEGMVEPALRELVPPWLEVARVRAVPRRLSPVGDVGLRALPALAAAAVRLHRRHAFELALLSVPSHYVAFLGPYLRARLGLPFVLDYVDPWVGAWGATVGGGPGGAVDRKSALSRRVGQVGEPLVVAAACGLTGVSERTVLDVAERIPWARRLPRLELPYGGAASDFEQLRRAPRPNPYFDRGDGRVHVCYVGALLPLGLETLRAVLQAAVRLRESSPERFARLRLHFFGTSNQVVAGAPERVLPIARELGVADIVREVAPRVPYLDALTILGQASAILMLGSSERHYTASKVYPGLLARRPILAAYHAESTVVQVLRAATRPPSVQLVTYDDHLRAASRVAELAAGLASLEPDGEVRPGDVDLSALAAYDAGALARRLGAFLHDVAPSSAGVGRSDDPRRGSPPPPVG